MDGFKQINTANPVEDRVKMLEERVRILESELIIIRNMIARKAALETPFQHPVDMGPL